MQAPPETGARSAVRCTVPRSPHRRQRRAPRSQRGGCSTAPSACTRVTGRSRKRKPPSAHSANANQGAHAFGKCKPGRASIRQMQTRARMHSENANRQSHLQRQRDVHERHVGVTAVVARTREFHAAAHSDMHQSNALPLARRFWRPKPQTPHHITSQQLASHHITLNHITSHHTTPHHITPHHITSHSTTPHHTTSHHTTRTRTLTHPTIP